MQESHSIPAGPADHSFERTGTVMSVAGGFARIAVAGGPICARCAAGRGCGAGLAVTGGGTRLVELGIPPGLALAAGDTVRLGISPANLLRASWLAYGVPLAGLLCGALLASNGTGDETAGVLLAVAGLLAGLAAGRTRLRRPGCARRLEPVILGSA